MSFGASAAKLNGVLLPLMLFPVLLTAGWKGSTLPCTLPCTRLPARWVICSQIETTEIYMLFFSLYFLKIHIRGNKKVSKLVDMASLLAQPQPVKLI